MVVLPREAGFYGTIIEGGAPGLELGNKFYTIYLLLLSLAMVDTM